MGKRALTFAAGCLMLVSLIVASCTSGPTTPATSAPPGGATSERPQGGAVNPPTGGTTTSAPPSGGQTVAPSGANLDFANLTAIQVGAITGKQKPQYGGTLDLVAAADVTNWDPNRLITGLILNLTSNQLWEGDWAKGPAGGFGTSETDWGFADNDLFDVKYGYLIQDWKWTVDNSTNTGTIVYHRRPGVHWALNPASEASRLVNGREMTTDDIIFSMKRSINGSYPDGYIYITNIELRTANITKTGPDEITIQVPLPALITAISRFGDSLFVVPPEVIAKYGDMQKWQNNVGTGPFMVTEYVPGSAATLVRNPNYFLTNPVGPGKGDRFPYLDSIHQSIIPDSSTRLAAFRTGKIDYVSNLNKDDADGVLKTTPNVVRQVGTSFQGRGTPAFMRIDKPPFNDIRVRKAMMLGTDFQSILKEYRGGMGQIVTFPFSKVRGYEELYVGLEDQDFPADARELYTYSPDKAKQLLRDAGYPNGFKASIILSSSATADIDYYSIIKGQWAKIGVDLALDLKDSVSVTSIQRSRSQDSLITNTTGPVAIWYVGNPIQGTGMYNLSMIDDPQINAAIVEARMAAITDMHAGMKIFREKIFKYAQSQVYVVPNVIGTYTNLWWPWIKNYSGEMDLGYDNINWPEFIWYDTALKKSMGY